MCESRAVCQDKNDSTIASNMEAICLIRFAAQSGNARLAVEGLIRTCAS